MTNKKVKSCFMICPIGKEDSPERFRSDFVQTYLLEPVLAELGYNTVRADGISAPGIITTQIIDRLLHDDLVIADLTGGNPNVYYELAVRHALRKACVQIIDIAESPHFDVSIQRTIKFKWQDLKGVADFRKKLADQIRVVEKDPAQVDSPISQAIDILALSKSGQPVEKWMGQVMRMLERISAEVCDTEPFTATFQGFPGITQGPLPTGDYKSLVRFIKPAAATEIQRDDPTPDGE